MSETMTEILTWTLPKIGILVLFVWYLRVATKSIQLNATQSSALSRQIEMMAEVERTGRLVGALAARHEDRLAGLETRNR